MDYAAEEAEQISINVTFGKWPWVGALFGQGLKSNETLFIGNAILIHQRLAVSTLRTTVFQEFMIIVLGNREDGTYQEIGVERLSAYNSELKYNDYDELGLLLLEKEAILGRSVRPICLWEAKETTLDVDTKSTMVVSIDNDTYVNKNKLLLRQEPMIASAPIRCTTLNFYSNYPAELTEVSEQQICAGTNIAFTCPFSGSGMFIKRQTVDGRDQWYLRAIAVKRFLHATCTNPRRWWVFIDVAQRRQWIDSHLKRKIECGKRQVLPTALIKGGTDSKPGYWPWHIALFHRVTTKDLTKDVYACGGSLLNAFTVMTGGHCVTRQKTQVIFAPEKFLIEVGRYYLYGDEITAQTRYVERVILYPHYNGTSLRHDISLLKLKTPALFNAYVQPVCLWEGDKLSKSYIVEKQGMVVGWGRTSNSSYSSILLETKMPVVADTTCYQSHQWFFSTYLTENSYCAGYQNNSGVCNGDSGGGMYFGQKYDNEIVWFQRGIVSLSLSDRQKSCDLEHYVIFTDIVNYLDWIKQNLM